MNEYGPISESQTCTPSLLARLYTHDTTAWQRLTQLYYPLVFRWCQRAGLQPEDCVDVVQEVFRVLAGNIAKFDANNGQSTFRGWLWGITRNKLKDFWRDKEQQPGALGGSEAQRRFSQVPEPNPDETSTVTSRDSTLLVHQAIQLIRNEFEDRTWQAFWRTAVENQSATDVATDLQMTVNAVYLAKSRILRRFRDEFGDILQEIGSN